MCVPGVCSVKTNKSRIFCFPTCTHHLFALMMLVYLESSLSVNSNHSSTAQKLEVSEIMLLMVIEAFLECLSQDVGLFLRNSPHFLRSSPHFLNSYCVPYAFLPLCVAIAVLYRRN